MYSKILVPVDGSAASLKGLDEAIKLAKAVDAKIKLVHVVNAFILDAANVASTYYEQVISSVRDVGRGVLISAEQAARQQGVTVDALLVEATGGPVADAIIDSARQWPADLIVLGTHGRRGLRRLALGSDAELVLRRSAVPVLMVREVPEREVPEGAGASAPASSQHRR